MIYVFGTYRHERRVERRGQRRRAAAAAHAAPVHAARAAAHAIRGALAQKGPAPAQRFRVSILVFLE